MSEMFETFSNEQAPLGLVPRDEVHRLGLWHRASSVFLFRGDGRLVTQLRHPDKDVCPNMWDLSVAEHLQPGENYHDGAIRGLEEELGIVGVSLTPIGDEVRGKLELPELGIIDCEFQQCFRGVSDAEIVPQSDEVADIRLFELTELKSTMQSSPTMFTPWFRRHVEEIALFADSASTDEAS